MVGVLTAGVVVKHIHFVLEFVEGGSLYRVVKKYGTFTEKLCAIYMRQTVLGLQYLHTLPVPILHRDVVRGGSWSGGVDAHKRVQKGANLLLTKEGQGEEEQSALSAAASRSCVSQTG